MLELIERQVFLRVVNFPLQPVVFNLYEGSTYEIQCSRHDYLTHWFIALVQFCSLSVNFVTFFYVSS